MTLPPLIARTPDARPFKPLDTLMLGGFAPEARKVAIKDSADFEYARFPIDDSGRVTITVGGALGTQIIRVLAADGTELARAEIKVDAQTAIDDSASGGRFGGLLAACVKSMKGTTDGVGFRTYRGRKYPFYVHWILDHAHTAKGMQFFADAAGGLVDLQAELQREDGMIWSFIDADPGPGYFDTRDHGRNENTRRVPGEVLMVRQPVENHCEYNFVSAMHLAWKASGDSAWMAGRLDNAIRALEYTVHACTRWSDRLGLLKRGYTIDSWDFQVNDAYTVDLGMGSDMLIDADRTRFGVFFGDNHGYAAACDELAEMLIAAGRMDEAASFARRGGEIRDRLTSLTWNGQFFRHRMEEDPAVKRDLGVDEAQQIAMSNCYATNRGITAGQSAAILETYRSLRRRPPAGSPGEWYAIYPPFERGFERHSAKWQYMNGGVHAHAAGELARGAFASGGEADAVDILGRLADLAAQSKGKIKFCYTGAIASEPAPTLFTPIDLSGQANMSLAASADRDRESNWMHSTDAGNDLRNLPTGRQTLAGIPFDIAAGPQSAVGVAVAVAVRMGFAQQVEIPLNGSSAGALYLLHTVNQVGPSQLAGSVTFVYARGETQTVYLQIGKHVAGWWFPKLKAPDAGIAWRGPNAQCTDVGVCWAAMANPRPGDPIAAIRFDAALDGAAYVCCGLTLGDRMPFHAPELLSYGGPDSWAGGTVTLALVEGLAGVKDDAGATRYDRVTLSPRWLAADVTDVSVTVRRAASTGYLSYRLRHDGPSHTVDLDIVSGGAISLRLLLPAGAKGVQRAAIDGRVVPAAVETSGTSLYAILSIGDARRPLNVRIDYALS